MSGGSFQETDFSNYNSKGENKIHTDHSRHKGLLGKEGDNLALADQMLILALPNWLVSPNWTRHF